jgi:hypothetical protein
MFSVFCFLLKALRFIPAFSSCLAVIPFNQYMTGLMESTALFYYILFVSICSFFPLFYNSFSFYYWFAGKRIE